MPHQVCLFLPAESKTARRMCCHPTGWKGEGTVCQGCLMTPMLLSSSGLMLSMNGPAAVRPRRNNAAKNNPITIIAAPFSERAYRYCDRILFSQDFRKINQLYRNCARPDVCLGLAVALPGSRRGGREQDCRQPAQLFPGAEGRAAREHIVVIAFDRIQYATVEGGGRGDRRLPVFVQHGYARS